MPDFIFLHHDDASGDGGLDWEPYLSRLREAGVFQGGSRVGEGHCVKKSGVAPDPITHITGFVRVTAKNLDEARGLLPGNPVFEAGGTVEIRVYVISNFSNETSGRFVHWYMSMYFGVHAMQNTVKATVDSLRLPTFQNFELRIPETREEQIAIAQVLNDIEDDLAALGARLTKARRIKQGMMQDLLTGRVRLV